MSRGRAILIISSNYVFSAPDNPRLGVPVSCDWLERGPMTQKGALLEKPLAFSTKGKAKGKMIPQQLVQTGKANFCGWILVCAFFVMLHIYIYISIYIYICNILAQIHVCQNYFYV